MTARRWAAGLGVAAVALVAAVMSYEHQRILAAEHGQPEFLAALWPLGVDGLILACGIQLATDRAAGYRPRVWAVVGFWLGVVVSVAANALATPGGVVARMISAFPAVALLIAVESLTTRPRRRTAEAEVCPTVHADVDTKPDTEPTPVDPVPAPRIVPVPVPALRPVLAAQGRTDSRLVTVPVRRIRPRASTPRAARADDELLAVLADVPRDDDGTVPVRRAAAALGCGPDRARRLLGEAGLLKPINGHPVLTA